MAGLLIVNADDLGAEVETTDAIVRCLEARAVTSATAMVFMPDSERAAEIACRRELPVGLHLNLTLPFGGPAPAAVRDRQARAAALFGGRGPGKHKTYHPLAHFLVRRCIADQLEEFGRLYGAATHIDGHNHIHLSPNVLIARALPKGVKVRRSADSPGDGSASARVARSLRQWTISRRFRSTDYFFALDRVHPSLGGDGLERVLGLVATASVELMCHPGRSAEYELLMSEDWRQLLRRRPIGSFAALEPGSVLRSDPRAA